MKTFKSQSSGDIKTQLVVLRSQTGDEGAFRQLYEQFHRSTLRFLQSLIKGDNASDLNQEVWILVFKKISTLSDASRFKFWLFRIARNQAMDYLRKNKRSDYFDERIHYGPAPPMITEEEGADLMSQEQIFRARESLSTKLKEVIELYYFQGMDYKEIALIVGCSIGTVKSRLHAARNKMKDYINKNH